jgi:hypothetical protein
LWKVDKTRLKKDSYIKRLNEPNKLVGSLLKFSLFKNILRIMANIIKETRMQLNKIVYP